MSDKLNIENIIKLAKLDIDQDKKETYAKQFEEIVGLVDTLDKADTSSIENVNDNKETILRVDENINSNLKEDILKAAKNKKNDCFKVKKVV